MLYQDMEMHDIPFWSYFCQISDSTTSYGSYSGAVPNEKITWGKLDIKTPKFIIESDATIVAQVIFLMTLDYNSFMKEWCDCLLPRNLEPFTVERFPTAMMVQTLSVLETRNEQLKPLVKTETLLFSKVSTKLAERIENFDE
jgi:hypothetical protein